jgi:chromate reductase
MHTVAVLVGSLRRESENLKLARALEKLARGKLDFRFIDLSGLPLYNEDLWPSPPQSVPQLKAGVEAADGVLFVSPEYNRSVTPAIKTAIDWGTRPWGQNSWAGKPVGIVGASVGQVGTAVGQAHLRAIMTAIDAIVMGVPEVYITHKPGMFSAQHDITDEGLRKFLSDYIDRFAGWIARHGGK